VSSAARDRSVVGRFFFAGFRERRIKNTQSKTNSDGSKTVTRAKKSIGARTTNPSPLFSLWGEGAREIGGSEGGIKRELNRKKAASTFLFQRPPRTLVLGGVFFLEAVFLVAKTTAY
jgi:hypothetical protein